MIRTKLRWRPGSFFERGPNQFGLCSVWILCGIAIVLAACPFEFEKGERIGPSTLFSWLPTTVLSSPQLFLGARIWLVVSAVAWATMRAVPWSSWSTAVTFTLVWSLRMENTSHAAHIFNVANMLLWIHAMWFQFEGHAIKRATKSGTLWTSKLYPQWVYMLSVFYICWFHGWAGITKLQTSGVDWGNGLSLQLWVYLWGWRDSPTTQMILSNRFLTRLLQTGALVFETTSLLGIVSKWARWIVGVNLVAFYCGVLSTFVDYGFHANAILVAMFMLPIRDWTDRRFGQRDSSLSEQAHMLASDRD